MSTVAEKMKSADGAQAGIAECMVQYTAACIEERWDDLEGIRVTFQALGDAYFDFVAGAFRHAEQIREGSGGR